MLKNALSNSFTRSRVSTRRSKKYRNYNADIPYPISNWGKDWSVITKNLFYPSIIRFTISEYIHWYDLVSTLTAIAIFNVYVFFSRYANLPFAKSIEKYVKYTPEQVAAMMDRFFDIAAWTRSRYFQKVSNLPYTIPIIIFTICITLFSIRFIKILIWKLYIVHLLLQSSFFMFEYGDVYKLKKFPNYCSDLFSICCK